MSWPKSSTGRPLRPSRSLERTRKELTEPKPRNGLSAVSGRFHDDSVRLRHRGGICGAQIPAGIFFFQGKHLRSLPGRDLPARRPAACLARRIPPPKWPAPLSSRNAPILAVPSAITSTNFAYIVSGSAGEFLSFFKCSLKKYLFPKVSWYF